MGVVAVSIAVGDKVAVDIYQGHAALHGNIGRQYKNRR